MAAQGPVVTFSGKMAACCPPNSAPHLSTEYKAKGAVHSFDGVDFYSVGSTTSKQGILIIPDVFGWNGSRTRNIADHFADLDGVRGSSYYVVIPKILTPPLEGGNDGDGLPADFDVSRRDETRPFIRSFTWEILAPRVNAILRHLVEQGITKIALVGFCWGGWVTSHIQAQDDPASSRVLCAVVPHPSITCEEMHGGDPVALVSRARSPALLLPAGNDSDRYRPGGDILEALRQAQPDSDVALDFAAMQHGWAVRGDVSDPAVRAAVDLAVDKTLQFIAAQFAKAP